MKIDVTITAWNSNDEQEYLREEIIEEAARQILNKVMKNSDYYDGIFEDILTDFVKDMIKKEMGKDFKQEIKEQISKDIISNYNKTQQYRELKKEYEILSETEIKKSLSNILQDIVRTEIKKCFK